MRLNSSCNPRLSSSRAPYGLADPAENASELSLSPVPVPLPLHILISDKFHPQSFSQSTLIGILLPWSALEMEPLLPPLTALSTPVKFPIRTVFVLVE